MAQLANSGVAYQSIRVYLSGLRFWQIASSLPDPCLASIPVLSYVLRGIHRTNPGNRRPPRLPITPDILQTLFNSWSSVPEGAGRDASMLWAAVCLGYFGFMRAGEFTCSSLQAFTEDVLSPRDVTVDSYDNPSTLAVHLRRSKTDPFGQGVTIYLGRTGQSLCPVAALLGYLVQRGQCQGPLFLFQDGSPPWLSRS